MPPGHGHFNFRRRQFTSTITFAPRYLYLIVSLWAALLPTIFHSTSQSTHRDSPPRIAISNTQPHTTPHDDARHTTTTSASDRTPLPPFFIAKTKQRKATTPEQLPNTNPFLYPTNRRLSIFFHPAARLTNQAGHAESTIDT